MNNIVKISNPMLVGAIALLKKKNSPENRKLFMDELFHAKLLAPAVITPPPMVDENGNRKITKDNKMTFPMLKDKDEKRYFTIFTDLNEMRQIKAEGYLTVIPVTFKSMAELVAASNEACSGVIINPYGDSVALNRPYIEAVLGTLKKPDAEGKEEPIQTNVEADPESMSEVADEVVSEVKTEE